MTRIEGPTPNGGAYAEATWIDDNGLEVEDPSEATGAEIQEFDSEGKPLMRTYATVFAGDGERPSGIPDMTPTSEVGVQDQDLLKRGSWDLWAVIDGQWLVADTLPKLRLALGIEDDRLEDQRTAICALLDLPAWEPAPAGLKTEVYAWLDHLGAVE